VGLMGSELRLIHLPRISASVPNFAPHFAQMIGARLSLTLAISISLHLPHDVVLSSQHRQSVVYYATCSFNSPSFDMA